MRAPRSTARSICSRSRKPAPSPITNPSRSTSNGREASSGSSLRVDSVVMRQKAEMVIGVITASAPPAMTTSAEPSRIMRTPSPMAFDEVAQAVATQKLGPVQPNSMPMTAVGALAMNIGTVNGLTAR